MATPRFPRRSAAGRPSADQGTVGHRAACGVVVLAGVVAILLSALAASPPRRRRRPRPRRRRLMAARAHDLEVVTEKFDAARVRLARRGGRAQAATAKMQKAARRPRAAAQQQVRGHRPQRLHRRRQRAFQALMTSKNADDFVDRMTTLQTIAGHQDAVLQTAVDRQPGRRRRRRPRRRRRVPRRRRTYDAVARQQATCRRRSPTYQADFNRLSAAEQQAAVAAAEAAVPPRDARASRAERGGARRRARPAPVVASQPGRADRRRHRPGPARQALRLGGRRPRLLRLLGPGRVRLRAPPASACRTRACCSRRWAGRSPAPQLQPGDLVFFYSPVSHVGMYIGNGQMVHAPTTGDVVKVSSIDVMGYFAGARRIAG